MRLVEQWGQIEAGLPSDWSDARLLLTLADEANAEQGVALLGPLSPGRHGRQLRFFTARRGAGFGPEHLRRLLRRLDEERIGGTLELLAAREAALEAPMARQTLAESWTAALSALPPDWSDAYAELELQSTDHLERGALLLAPLNPARFGARPGFRFRVARRFGYGASAEMVRRCLERLDEESIRGRVEILRALSDTRPVATQGPVWRIGGKAV